MRSIILGFLLISMTPQYAFASTCNELLGSLSSPQVVSVEVVKDVERDWKAPVEFLKAKKGYAILIGTMIGSAALATFLTSHLPTQFSFFSQLLSQLSTLGVYVFGSPIWEPLSSGFRKFAFGVSQAPDIQTETSTENQRLETVWLRTQENYSLNSQMSRNIINLFISSTRQNFYEAYGAIHSGNKTYAADQVAEAAVRMRMLFKDIPPDDSSVKLAIRSAFSAHIDEPGFSDLVRQQIQINDPDFDSKIVSLYYQRLMAAWFVDLSSF